MIYISNNTENLTAFKINFHKKNLFAMSRLRKFVGNLQSYRCFRYKLHLSRTYMEFVKGATDIFLWVGAVVATISISRYTLRFRGVNNTEEVICGFLPRSVSDRDKSKCGCCYTESKVVVFSQGNDTQLRCE